MKLSERLVRPFAYSLVAVFALALSAEPVLAQNMPREETLIVRAGRKFGAPELYNPYLAGHRGETGNWWMAENLFYMNLYQGEIVPWLGTEFKYGPDHDTITIHLREGVKWNDGEEFNADDVVFTYNMLKENAPILRWSVWIREWMTEVRAVDSHTVFIQLKEPHTRAHYSFLIGLWVPPIVPEHIWSKQDPTTFKNFPDPVWTGPYRLLESSAEAASWERRDDYWGKDVMGEFPGAKFLLVTGPGPAEKMMIEQIEHRMDVWSGFTKSQYETVVRRNEDVDLWVALDPCTRALWFNIQRPPLDKREVRWAISYAINKNKLNFAAFEGATTTTKLPYPYYGTITPYLEEWKDILDEYDTELYDPQRAVAILDDLGFEKGRDGIYVTPDGTRLSWIIISPPWTGHREMAQSISEDLKAIGVDASWKVLEPAPHGEAWRRNQYDMNVAWACAEGLGHAWDPYAWLEGFHSRYAMPAGESADQNRIRYSDPEFDALLDELTGLLPDDPRAQVILKQAQQIYMRDLPVLGTLQTVFSNTFDTLHWKGFPSAEDPYMTPNHWWPHFLFTLLAVEPQ